MFLIILGVLLWTGAHYFKRLMPERRAAMGNAGKGVATAGILAGLLAMIVGYRCLWHQCHNRALARGAAASSTGGGQDLGRRAFVGKR